MRYAHLGGPVIGIPVTKYCKKCVARYIVVMNRGGQLRNLVILVMNMSGTLGASSSAPAQARTGEIMTVDNRFFEQPIPNFSYEYPTRHWELDPQGQPTQQRAARPVSTTVKLCQKSEKAHDDVPAIRA
jgi:hypothetical protein